MTETIIPAALPEPVLGPAPSPAELSAELEAAWLWTDALTGLGDPQDRTWPELSALAGGTEGTD